MGKGAFLVVKTEVFENVRINHGKNLGFETEITFASSGAKSSAYVSVKNGVVEKPTETHA